MVSEEEWARRHHPHARNQLKLVTTSPPSSSPPGYILPSIPCSLTLLSSHLSPPFHHPHELTSGEEEPISLCTSGDLLPSSLASLSAAAEEDIVGLGAAVSELGVAVSVSLFERRCAAVFVCFGGMERRGDKVTAAEARARRHADQPSFSSSLLDAIYRSMEDEPGHAGGDAATAAATKKKQQQQKEALHYSYYYRPSLAGSYRARAPAASAAPGPHATTSSSSECSSYGGFSSSEAESSNHRRLRPIRTTVPGGAPPPAPEKKTKKPAGASIRAKLRDLRKPDSPGARLAGFLNTIFAGKRGAPQTPPSARRTAAAEYACLSKTPSTRGQTHRTVRFVDSDREAPSTVPGADRRRVPVEQMLLRRMEMESDEDDDESSDASSDLFELENLVAAAATGTAPPGGAGYRDELPVYETTRVVLSRGIGHAYGHGRSARVV